MIDWISADIPFPAHEPITGDKYLCISPDGEIKYQKVSSAQFRGSHESTIMVKTKDAGPPARTQCEGAVLAIDGNPTKFIQGHNLFGTNDLQGLVGTLADILCDMLGVIPSDEMRRQWWSGDFDLRRVDCTENYHLGTEQKVLTALRSLESNARLTRRGRGEMYKDGTVMFGKGSRRSVLKAYGKGQELRKHKLPATLPVESLSHYASDILRFEATYRGMELDRIGYRKAYEWTEQTPSELLEKMMSALTITDTPTNEQEFINELPRRLRADYYAWKAGADLRELYSKTSFYRKRAQLLNYGVDISIKQGADTENVVPLVHIITMTPAGVPEWAYGTDLYFEPPIQPPRKTA